MELTHEFEVGVPIQEAWTVLTDLERIAPCLPGAQLQEIDGDEYRGTVKVKVGPISAQYKGKAHFSELDETARRAVLSASGRDTKGQGNASATISAQLADVGGRTQVSLLTDLNLTGKVAQFGRGVLADVSSKLMGQFVDNLEATVLGAPPEETLPPISTGSAVAAVAQPEGTEPGATEPGATEPEATEPGTARSEVTEAGATEPSTPGSTAPTPGAPRDRATGSQAAAPASPGPRRVDSPEVEPVDLLETAGTPVLKRLVPVVVVVVTVALVLRALRRRR